MTRYSAPGHEKKSRYLPGSRYRGSPAEHIGRTLMPHRARRAKCDPASVGVHLLTLQTGASPNIEPQTSQTAPESNDRESRYCK